MSFKPRSALGHYDVTALIGEGGTGQDRTLDTPGDLPSRLGVLLSETVGRASFGHASNHTDVIDDRPFLASKGVFGPSPAAWPAGRRCDRSAASCAEPRRR